MQDQSLLGILLNQGFLPNSTAIKGSVTYLEMIKHVYEEMLTAKSEGGMQKMKQKFYQV